MPNWCYNSEYIVGPKEQVKPLYDKLTKWIHDDVCKNDFHNGWIGNIVAHSGINGDKEPDSKKYLCRGELEDEFEYEENDTEGIISFSTTTAWGPFPETWGAVIKKHAPAARYYYMADEPNMAIYESNDINHKFFNEEFVVSYGFWNKDTLPEIYKKEFEDAEDGMFWDWDPDEVIGMMERITGIQIHDYDNDDEIKLLMDAFERKTVQDLDEDNYINVYKIEYYNPEKVSYEE